MSLGDREAESLPRWRRLFADTLMGVPSEINDLRVHLNSGRHQPDSTPCSL